MSCANEASWSEVKQTTSHRPTPGRRTNGPLVVSSAGTQGFDAARMSNELIGGYEAEAESFRSRRATREMVEAELSHAGLRLAEWWTDSNGDYALSLSRRR